jgi:hypothetical protein
MLGSWLNKAVIIPPSARKCDYFLSFLMIAPVNVERYGNADVLPVPEHVVAYVYRVDGLGCNHSGSQSPQQTAPDGHKHDSGGNAFSNDGDVFSVHGSGSVGYKSLHECT